MLNQIHVCLALVTFHSVGISTAAFESQTSSYLEVTLEKMSLNVQAKRTWILFGFTEEEFAQIHANAEAPFQSFLDFEKMEEVLSRDEELTLIGKDEQLNKFGQLQKALIGRRPRRVMVFVGRDAALDKLEDYEPIGFELEIYQEQVDPGKFFS